MDEFTGGCFLDKLIFSQSGVYRLQQLASQVYRHCGMRHKLSQQEGIVELLQFSSISDHQVVRAYFAAFTNCLDRHQRDLLIERGVKLNLPNAPVEHPEQAHFSLTG